MQLILLYVLCTVFSATVVSAAPSPAVAVAKLVPFVFRGNQGLVSVAAEVGETGKAIKFDDAMRFLEHYGYLKRPNPQLGEIMTERQLAAGLMLFQRFAGLRQTGIMDRETLVKMEQPRCGNADVVGTEAAARKKRYALQGSKWNKKHLTYKFLSHTTDLRHHETERAIADAFKYWEKESGLTFSKTSSSQADIKIQFASRAHGDGDPFDGRGQTLAHAYFPQFGGDAHFDEDEVWVMGKSGGTSLEIVAAHEFGHSLGLSHSDNSRALMAPFYNPNVDELHRDDITAIRTLYGAPEDRTKPTTTRRPWTTRRTTRRPGPTRRTTTTKTPPVGACNGRFGAITRIFNGSTYAFKDDRFWKLNDEGMEKGYPQKTSAVWGFFGDVDATLTYENEYTDFFQGDKVRRFVRGIALRNYPKYISEVYPGMPSDIDTAFVWSGNGRIYFVKGEQYWRFNPSTRQADSGYPRPLSVWRGLPSSGLDAALQWHDKTYFFKNGYYWRFDDEKAQVAQSLKVAYPRRADEWWLGCSDNTLRSSPDDTGTGDKDDDEEGSGGNGSGSLLRQGSGQSILVIAPTLLLVALSKMFT